MEKELEVVVVAEPKKIGLDEIRRADTILQSYKDGKKNLENRIISNERWWKMRHWEQIRNAKTDIEPSSAWMFNALANKHADAMDNYPQPNVLPREESDQATAEKLSAVLPTILEFNEYPQVYSDIWWYKIKNGTGISEVVWDNTLNNGLGDIAIRKADLLNLFWEPGVTDIQKSANLFHVELRSREAMQQAYPNMDFSSGDDGQLAKYIHDDTIDTSGKVMVVDWYYKKDRGGKTILHYCQYSGENVLFASENNPEEYPEGYYDHGKYPFVFDPLFPEEDTPAGFGYIDIMKSCQTYIDKLNGAILKNILVTSRKRLIVRSDGGINEEELADVENDIIHSSVSLAEDSFREISYTPLPGIAVNVLQSKIDELKETSGNRDFSQGSTTNGVTAASAIAALQEAGSKLSRDMIHASYRAFSRVCNLVIELIRQFYTEKRVFRITGDNGYEFTSLDNTELMPQPQGTDFGLDMGVRLPVFDVHVVPEKESSYSRLSNNELALQFFQLGFFNPQMADQALATVNMMKFEGKEDVITRISEGQTLYEQVLQLQQQLAQLAQVVDAQNGTQVSQTVAEEMQGAPAMPQGRTRQKARSQAERAAEIASSQAAPR